MEVLKYGSLVAVFLFVAFGGHEKIATWWSALVDHRKPDTGGESGSTEVEGGDHYTERS